MIFFVFLLANSDIYIVVIIPIGIEIQSATKVTQNDPTKSGKSPYLPERDIHSVPKKNFERG